MFIRYLHAVSAWRRDRLHLHVLVMAGFVLAIDRPGNNRGRAHAPTHIEEGVDRVLLLPVFTLGLAMP